MFKKLIFERHCWPVDREKVSAAHKGNEIIIKRTKGIPCVSFTEKFTVSAADFLKKLDAAEIPEWEDNYFVPVLDGENWSLKYFTEDGAKKSVTGSNAYPAEYDALMDLLFAEYEDAEKTVINEPCGEKNEEQLIKELEDEDIDFRAFLEADDKKKAEMLEYAGLEIYSYIQYFDDKDFYFKFED